MIKKMIRWLFHAALLLYIGILAVIIVPGLMNIYVETVTSGSMEPAIHTGSVIYVRSASFEDIRKGDVITYIIDERNTKVTHRVADIDIGSQSFRTKGDANAEMDKKNVLMENVLGKVLMTIPFLGRISILLTSVRGKAALIVILLVLAFLDSAVNRSLSDRQVGKEKKRNETL